MKYYQSYKIGVIDQTLDDIGFIPYSKVLSTLETLLIDIKNDNVGKVERVLQKICLKMKESTK